MIEFDAPFYIQSTSTLIEKLKSDNTISEHQAIQTENEYLEKVNNITINLQTIQQNTLKYKEMQMGNIKCQNDVDLLEIKLLASPRFAEIIKELNELQRRVDYQFSSQFDSEIENIKLTELHLAEQESMIELKRQQRELLEPLLKSQVREYLSDLRDKEQEIVSKTIEISMRDKEIEQIQLNIQEVTVKRDKIVEQIDAVQKELGSSEQAFQANIVNHRSLTSDINKQDQMAFDLNLVSNIEQTNRVKIESERRKQNVNSQKLLSDIDECVAVQSDLEQQLVKMEKDACEFDNKIMTCCNKQEQILAKNKSMYKELFTEEKKKEALLKLERITSVKLLHLKKTLQDKTDEYNNLLADLRIFHLDNREVFMKSNSLNHLNDIFVKNCVDLSQKINLNSVITQSLKGDYQAISKDLTASTAQLNRLVLSNEAMENKYRKLKKLEGSELGKLTEVESKLSLVKSDLKLVTARIASLREQEKSLNSRKLHSLSATKLLSISITKRQFVLEKKLADIKNKERSIDELEIENNVVNEKYLKQRELVDAAQFRKDNKQHDLENMTVALFSEKELLQSQRSQMSVSLELQKKLHFQFQLDLEILNTTNVKKSDLESKLVLQKRDIQSATHDLSQIENCMTEQNGYFSNLKSRLKVLNLRLHPMEQYFNKHKDIELKYYESTTELEQVKREYLEIQDKICHFKINSSHILIKIVGKDITEDAARSQYNSLLHSCTTLMDAIREKSISLERSKQYLLSLELDYYLKRQDYFTYLVPKNKRFRSAFENQSVEKANKAESRMYLTKNESLEFEITELRHKIANYVPSAIVGIPKPSLPAAFKRVTAYIPNDDFEQLPKPFLFRPFISVPNRKVKDIKVGMKPVVI